MGYELRCLGNVIFCSESFDDVEKEAVMFDRQCEYTHELVLVVKSDTSEKNPTAEWFRITQKLEEYDELVAELENSREIRSQLAENCNNWRGRSHKNAVELKHVKSERDELAAELERVKAERDEMSAVIDKLDRHFFELQDDSNIVHDSVERLREILGVKNEL